MWENLCPCLLFAVISGLAVPTWPQLQPRVWLPECSDGWEGPPAWKGRVALVVYRADIYTTTVFIWTTPIACLCLLHIQTIKTALLHDSTCTKPWSSTAESSCDGYRTRLVLLFGWHTKKYLSTCTFHVRCLKKKISECSFLCPHVS